MIITKLALRNFRNFTSKEFDFPNEKSMNLLAGRNGAGKTNALEALTLLGRSDSIRGANFEEMVLSGQNQSVVSSKISNHEFIEKLSVDFDLEKKKKKLYVNGEPFSSKRQEDVKSYLINFIFLTPTLEQLFISGKSKRREYLDKIVSDIDLSHNSRVNSYQKLLKERLLILQKYRGAENSWVNIVEEKIVELAAAIAFSRSEAIEFFNNAIDSFSSNFPKSKLFIICEIDKMLKDVSAAQFEEIYKNKLKENRKSDLENFKTNFGIHRSDFDARFIDKKISATNLSTGEQKAVMMSITLARAKISSIYKNQPTILLFDEVISHLDETRKENLLDEISQINLQSFFTATSASLLPVRSKVNVIEV